MNKIATHHSHFGINQVNRHQNVTHLISTSVTSLKRLAYTLGLSVSDERYRIEQITPAGAVHNTSDVVGYWLSDDNGNLASIAKYDVDGNWYLQIQNDLYDLNFLASF